MGLGELLGFGHEEQAPQASVSPSQEKRERLPLVLRDAEAWVAARASLLPLEGVALVWQCIDLTWEVLSLAERLEYNTLLLLDRTHQDYLPHLLQAYERAAAGGGGSPAALVSDLLLLVESLSSVREAVTTANRQALETQSVFLSSKFGGNDLE